MRTLRPTPLWLMLCPFLLAGCIGNGDPPPVPRIPAAGRFGPLSPDGPQVSGQNQAQQQPDNPPAPGSLILPSKYMLMAPASNGNPDRPPRVRPVAVPQGVPVGQDPHLPPRAP